MLSAHVKTAVTVLFAGALFATGEAKAVYQDCDSWSESYCSVGPDGNISSCEVIAHRYNCRTVYEPSDWAFLAGPGSTSDYLKEANQWTDGWFRNRDNVVSNKLKAVELPSPCEQTSRPVVIPTGEKVLTEVDLTLIGLDVTRSYAKNAQYSGILGSRWSVNFEKTLTFEYGTLQCKGKLNGLMSCSGTGQPTAIYEVGGGYAKKFNADSQGVYVTVSGDRITQAGATWQIARINGVNRPGFLRHLQA
jgi:hypothetical protein